MCCMFNLVSFMSSSLCALLNCVLHVACWAQGKKKADWSMHLTGNRWGTGQYCSSLQNFSAYSTCFLFTLFTHLSSSSSLSSFSPYHWDMVRGRLYACKWLSLPSFSLPFFYLFYFLSLSESLSSCPVSYWLRLDRYVKTTKHGEQPCCHRSSGRHSERGG